jgi:hypothetical protein
LGWKDNAVKDRCGPTMPSQNELLVSPSSPIFAYEHSVVVSVSCSLDLQAEGPGAFDLPGSFSV